MKLLIVLGIIGVIFLLIYLRLRPYIRMARQMFGVAREVGRAAGQTNASSPAGDRLVRCAACETWIPSSRALQLRSSGAAYCSTSCLENTAEGGRRKAAS